LTHSVPHSPLSASIFQIFPPLVPLMGAIAVPCGLSVAQADAMSRGPCWLLPGAHDLGLLSRLRPRILATPQRGSGGEERPQRLNPQRPPRPSFSSFFFFFFFLPIRCCKRSRQRKDGGRLGCVRCLSVRRGQVLPRGIGSGDALRRRERVLPRGISAAHPRDTVRDCYL